MASFGQLVSVLALGVLSGASGGCTPGSASDDGDGGSGGSDAATTSSAHVSSGAGETSASGSVTEGKLGVVVIDVQETFVDGASNPDMPSIIDRTGALFTLAAEHEVPFFVTFEASQSGDHALHAPLVPLLPSQASDFIKTTFAATGLSSFANAVEAAALTHVVVVGAETDVCVMQTVLGLRAMGLTVLLEQDAVFSEETNTSPALRRMAQAGVLLVDQADVSGYVADQTHLPVGNDAPVRIALPLQTGVVLTNLTSAGIAASGDAFKTQKLARLRELLLVSEWFELPVYVEDVAAGLPAELEEYFWGQLRPIDQIASDIAVTQLVFAGTDGGIATSVAAWDDGRDVFVMEDALLAQGSSADQAALLAPLFEQGAVPTTYKSFWYDMTKSVDTAEWPSQAWVQKLDEYYPITQAPEDLPPI
ncbi:MAG: isochorismatase family protein [Polyangiaceae bacterium]|nr:isochorismatase family protein [Polyangiaceae bacterium]